MAAHGGADGKRAARDLQKRQAIALRIVGDLIDAGRKLRGIDRHGRKTLQRLQQLVDAVKLPRRAEQAGKQLPLCHCVGGKGVIQCAGVQKVLQQTRVSAVIPYFERFMAELPDAAALATVPEERLLKLWEGLGYYSRARNLQKAAKVIVSDFGGELPRTCASLKTLPGIGDYTAAAIASINFGEPVAAVDGNLLRVAARVSGCADDIMDARVRKQFTAHLNDAIDSARPGAYNQAMMDLGATVCLPNGAPKCEICPARMMCEAYKNGLTEVLPVRAKKKARKIEERTVLLLFQNGKAALRKRADTGLLASLWEFPSVSGNLDEAGVSLVLAQMGLSAQTVEPAGSAKHIFTHIEWDMKGYFADVTGENDDLFWADAAAFDAAAIPTAFKKFAALVRARLQ